MRGLFVGLCTKDVIFYTDDLPAQNNKAKTESFATYIGGPAANAAITYAALGGDATLATCLGDSAESRAMLEELEGYGVRVLNYSVSERVPNTACITVSSDGSRTILSGQKLFEVNRTYELTDFDFALFDCNQQEISLDILRNLKGTPVVLDAGNWKPNMEEFLDRADIVIASEDFRDSLGNDIFSMQGKATERAMTCGEKPIRYGDREIPVADVKAVDTLGAGDIFHGAFCYAHFAEGLKMDQALYFAALVAGESVKYPGPRAWMKQMVTKSE